MILSHNKKFIFIHNYKVAGASIRKALESYNFYSKNHLSKKNKVLLSLGYYPHIFTKEFNQHITTNELKEQLPSSIFDNYFKFGFVRNPYAWQVSLYHFMLKDKSHHQHDLIKEMKDFQEYIHWRVNHEVRLQKKYFYDDNDDLLADYVGKLENLQHDMDTICEKIKIPLIQIPHINTSKHKHFSDYYTDETSTMVYNAFLPDFETFGYKRL